MSGITISQGSVAAPLICGCVFFKLYYKSIAESVVDIILKVININTQKSGARTNVPVAVSLDHGISVLSAHEAYVATLQQFLLKSDVLNIHLHCYP